MRRFLSLLLTLLLFQGSSYAQSIMLLGAGPEGSASAPTLQGTPASTANASGFSVTVNLPSGIVSGELLYIIIAHSNSSAAFSATGWTVGAQSNASNGSGIAILWKSATGSEGASVSVSGFGGSVASVEAVRVSHPGADNPSFGTTANSASCTTPDPPSLTPAFGSKAALWFSVAGWDVNSGSAATPSGWPTNYTGNQTFAGSGVQGVAFATRSQTTTTDNPGTFTVAFSTGCSGQTFASD